MKIANIDREILLKDLRNFNEIFRKDVTYNIIKSQKTQDFTFLEKPQGRQTDPPTALLELIPFYSFP